MKLIFAIVIALTAALAFAFRCRPEDIPNRRRHRSENVLVSPLMLPLYLITIYVCWLVFLGADDMMRLMGSTALLFLHIGAYFCLLLCILPLLRRFFSAKACATLWLLPNLLYYTVYLSFNDRDPHLVLTLPGSLLAVIGAVWFAGFAIVMLWQLAAHLIWRRSLLRDARVPQDERMFELWHSEGEKNSLRREIPILVSDRTRTPVTVGLFNITQRLVLPPVSYSEDEYRLIFRHEMQHICQKDVQTKAFVGFCTAMLWFNPFVWIARRRVAEDLELQCDEAVLIYADDAERRRYAELLLGTSGSSRGLTTCLSATANSLRYRLRNVVSPRRRFSGETAVGLAMFLLLMSTGSLALADRAASVGELVFDKAPQDVFLESVTTATENGNYFRGVYAWQEDELTEYIASLHAKRVYTGSYTEQGRGLYLYYAQMENGEIISNTIIELTDGVLWANIPYDDTGRMAYLIEGGVDWDYIDSLLDYEAEDPDPAPQPPWLNLYFDNDDVTDGEPLVASRRYLHVESGGEVRDYSDRNEPDIGGVHGFEVSEVRLEFTYPPAAGYQIKVEGIDGEGPYTLTDADCPGDVLPLAPYSAIYTVTAGFVTVRDTSYEMQFLFEVVLP